MSRGCASGFLSKERRADLDRLLISLGLTFKNYILLDQALTHKSYARELGGASDNERLEFLGDSVLGLIITHRLYERFPSFNEGRLARMRTFLVSESFLSAWAHSFDLGSYLLFSKGERLTGGAHKPSILADAFESFVGAFYLDQGYQVARAFIVAYIEKVLNKDSSLSRIQDSKVLLQQWVQKACGVVPTYKLLAEVGPEHSKTFIMGVQVEGQLLAKAEAKSKKEAEKIAARFAYRALSSGSVRLKGR